MAQTLYIADALNMLAPVLGRKVEENYSAFIANMAINLIWMKYDWRESLAQLPPFWLVPNEQEFGKPAYAVPTDFLGLREVYVVNLQSDPPYRRPLNVLEDLQLTAFRDFPRDISYNRASARFRIHPRTPSGIGCSDWLVDGTYKKKPTLVTFSTLNSTLIPWDDIYFQTFVAALKWAAWEAAGDQRAGEAQFRDGHVIYTGQLGKAHALIDEMAAHEGINLGDVAVAPSESLTGAGYVTGYSPYPGALA